MAKHTSQWLGRALLVAPSFKLCLSEADFAATLKQLNCPTKIDFVAQGKGASVHTLSSEDGSLVCVLCMRDHLNHRPIEVAGLLVHEAVHIWQITKEDIGEDSPGREVEAYSIQAIAQELMFSYVEQVFGKQA